MLPPGDRSDEDGTSVRTMLAGLRRQRWTVAASVAATLGLAVLFLVFARPVYESEATLRIVSQDQKSAILSQLPDIAGLELPGVGGDVIETEMGVLRSRRIADEVISTLGLQLRLTDPDLPRDSVLRVLSARPDTAEIEATFRRQPDGSYRTGGGDGQVVRPGQPFRLGPVELALAPRIGRTAPERVSVEIDPYHVTLERFRKTFVVEKQEGRSELVEITYRSPDPVLAAAVVETAVAAFVGYKEATDRSDLRRRVETLREQVASYRGQLESAEEDLRRYRERFRIVEPEEEAMQQVKMAALVRSEREEAMIERQALRATMDGARRGGVPGDLARQLAAFPTFITNAGVQAILTRLNETEEARSQLLLRRTPENADVRRLDERIAELELQLFRLANSYLESLDNQVAAADASLARFGAVAQQLPERELNYARLLRDQRLLNEIYLSLQGRLEEAQVQYATAPEEVRVIDRALLPVEPVWPRPLVTLVLAGVLGLMVGMMVSVAREAVDTSVRTRDEIEAITSIPVIAAIPRLRLPGERSGATLRARVLRLPSRTFGSTRDLEGSLLMAGSRHPEAAEAFRAIPATIGGRAQTAAHQVMLVTSPSQAEGKSLSAANLAVVLAQQGNRTLLLEGDLRSATLHRTLGAPRQPGLTDVLRGAASLEDAIRPIDLDRPAPLDLLASGSDVTDPPQLLGSQAAADLMTELRGRYDRIVVDAPDVLRYTDAAVIAGLADSVLIVVRAGSTDRDSLRHAVVRLGRMGIAVTGIVLNDVEIPFRLNGTGATAAAAPVPAEA